MDNLTHTLFGATLARTPLGRAGRGTTAALLLASNAPDIDIVSAAGGTMSYLHWHRGPTHGLLGILGLGALTAGLVWSWNRVADRRRAPATPAAPFGMLVAVSMLGVAFHVLMDLATSYGTRLLSPFDWHWYAFDWLPIVDIYLLVILAAGLIFGSVGDARPATMGRRAAARRSAARARMAMVAIVLMGVDYGVRAAAHRQAIAGAPVLFGHLLPPACDPRQPLSQGELAVWPSGRRAPATTPPRPCIVELAALPTFLSPFKWRVITHLSNAYALNDVDLLGGMSREAGTAADRTWSLSVRFPDQWTDATRVAARAPLAQIFLGFSRFPATRTFTEPSGTTVHWSDVRFAGGITSLQDRSFRPDPFNLVVRLDRAGQVIEQRAGR